jgi:hypothetical protein
MTYELLNERNLSAGLQVPLQYANDITGGIFFKVFLLSVFIGVTGASYFSQMRRKGDANFFMIGSVVGLILIMFMTLMSITVGIVTTTDFLFAIVFEFVFVLVFFLTERSPY